jgi:hypothetical protein
MSKEEDRDGDDAENYEGQIVPLACHIDIAGELLL